MVVIGCVQIVHMHPFSRSLHSVSCQCMDVCILAEVQHISIDDPSGKLFESIRAVCPNVKSMCPDPVHLAIVYEYATWRKRTRGSTFLRRIMVKFTAYDPDTPGGVWGTPYTGSRCTRTYPRGVSNDSSFFLSSCGHDHQMKRMYRTYQKWLLCSALSRPHRIGKSHLYRRVHATGWACC